MGMIRVTLCSVFGSTCGSRVFGKITGTLRLFITAGESWSGTSIGVVCAARVHLSAGNSRRFIGRFRIGFPENGFLGRRGGRGL